MTKSPDQLLETFLGRYYGLPLAYTPPAGLNSDGHDEVAADADEEATNGAESDVDKELRQLHQMFGDSPPTTDTTPEVEAPAESERE